MGVPCHVCECAGAKKDMLATIGDVRDYWE